MSPQVFKFGGTSVGSAEAVRLAIARVREAAPRVVAVVSAMAGVTDLLHGAAEYALAGRREDAERAAHEFGARHVELIGQLVPSHKAALELETLVAESTHELLSVCEAVRICAS